MKANELRIGNYIYCSKRFNSGTYLVSKDSFAQIMLDDDKGTKLYEPLPLTEEWLVRFGFVKVSNQFHNNFQYQDCSVKFEKEEFERGFWYSNDNSDAYCYRLKRINHVHQLQNLYFALTGEELTLKTEM